MANGDTPDVGTVLADPNFQSLPLGEKNKVLLRIDPNFKGLPPQEQMKALHAIHYGPEPQESSLASEVGGVLKRQAEGLGAMAVRPFTKAKAGYKAAGIPGAIAAGAEAATDPLGMREGLTAAAADTTANYGARRKAGYGPVYSAAAPTAAALTNVNLPSMEEGARTGNVNRVVAEAVVPAAEVAAGEAARQVGKIPAVSKRIPGTPAYLESKGVRQVGEGINVPTSEEAVELAARRGVPDRLSASKDLALVKDHLAQIERESPVKGKGADATLERARNVLKYADRYWETEHAAAIDRLGKAPFDSRPLMAAGEAAITPEAAEASPQAAAEAASARKWLQESMGKQRNLESADKLLREINADLETPAAQKNYGPVRLRTQSAVAKALRAEIDNTLIRYGEPGIKFKNMTYGALKNIGDRFVTQGLKEWGAEGKQGAVPNWLHVYQFVHPTPEGLMGSIGVSSRISQMFNKTPGARIAAGMGKLARSPLEPKSPTPAYSKAPTSPTRMLPEKSSAFGDPMVMSREMRLGQATRPEKMIQEAGGEFVEFQQDPSGGPRYVAFRDPETGRMFILREDKVSTAAVASRMKPRRAPARMTPPPQ